MIDENHKKIKMDGEEYVLANIRSRETRKMNKRDKRRKRKKRKENAKNLRGAFAQSKNNLFCISYVPLVYGTPNTYDMDMSEDNVKKLAAIIDEAPNQIYGCAWYMIDDTPAMSLVFQERAKEIYNHLMWWCGNETPDKWFIVYMKMNKEHQYEIVLHPDLLRSADRIRGGRAALGYATPRKDTSVIFLYKPLRLSGDGKTMVSIKDKLPKDKIEVSIISADDYPNQDARHVIGELPIGNIDDIENMWSIDGENIL